MLSNNTFLKISGLLVSFIFVVFFLVMTFFKIIFASIFSVFLVVPFGLAFILSLINIAISLIRIKSLDRQDKIFFVINILFLLFVFTIKYFW